MARLVARLAGWQVVAEAFSLNDVRAVGVWGNNRRRRVLPGRNLGGEERLEGHALQRLFADQLLANHNQPVFMLGQDFVRFGKGAHDDGANLFVDLAGGLLAIILLLANLAAQEDHLFLMAQRNRANLAAHAILCHHLAREAGGALDVVRGAGGDFAEDDQFGHMPAQREGQKILKLRLAVEVAIFHWQQAGIAAHRATRHDRNLMHRVAVGQSARHQRVPNLVVGGDRLFALADDAALALWPGNDAINGLFHLAHTDGALAAAGSQNGGLVEQVLKVGAGEARRLLGERFKLHAAVQRLALHVDVQNCQAPLDVGTVQHHLPVKAARAQQRRVQHVWAVGGGDDDHVGVGVKAIHLDQNLVERLLALVVRAAQARAALAAHRVNLINKNDAGRITLGLVKEVAHARGAHANEHLDKLGAADAEERHTRLAGHRPANQRLAGAWRANQQHAARDARANGGELIGIFQELDNLFQFLFGLIDAGHVGKRHGWLVAHEHARPALAERERLIIAPLRLAHHKDQHPTDNEKRQKRGQDIQQIAERAGWFVFEDDNRLMLDTIGVGIRRVSDVIVLENLRDEKVIINSGVFLRAAMLRQGDPVAGDGDRIIIIALGNVCLYIGNDLRDIDIRHVCIGFKDKEQQQQDGKD